MSRNPEEVKNLLLSEWRWPALAPDVSIETADMDGAQVSVVKCVVSRNGRLGAVAIVLNSEHDLTARAKVNNALDAFDYFLRSDGIHLTSSEHDDAHP